MIRLTVKELYELQRTLEASGQVNVTVGPREAFSTDKLFVAWAKHRNERREEIYLAVWRDTDSWRKVSGTATAPAIENGQQEEEESYDGVSVEERYDD